MTSSIPPSGSTSKLAFPGAVLVGKYRLEEVIGVGGMGSVWSATHLGLNQQIALKLVSSNFARSSDALRRFDNEAKAAAKIKSRHVPQVYDNGVLEDGTPFLAMELLHGETLFSRIHKGGPVPLPEAVRIIEHCCRGLGRAHSLGIIHRDIKPENIYLAHSVDDDNYIVKILDFGIAKITSLEAGEQSTTRTGALLGTPMFMSPEQARGLRTIDHRTDLYSLGLVTYMMFTGNLAFNGDTLGELLLQICTQPLPGLLAAAPWLPPPMEAWFQKACAREPDQRFPTAQAFIESMRIAGGLSAGIEQPGSYVPVAPGSLPVAYGCRIPAAIMCDHDQGELLLVAELGQESLLDQMAEDVRAALAAPPLAFPREPSLSGGLREEEGEIYLEGVRQVIDYILAGDVFQVNLSRMWSGKLKPGLSHAAIYDHLRKRNPSPFAGLAVLGSQAIISSSPERLVEVEGRIVQTRPIAGTRPRGTSGLTDVMLSEELIAHPKERAEHIMLVDLERNDLSRVCVPGTVKVNENMVIESYAQVHHIVSNIRGQLYENTAPGDIIRAIFPGGTITGCPKVRCMEIIAELERVGRGAYTGSMGYVNRDGGMDLNILIRTLVREGDSIFLRTGAGIVADSIPERELEETRAKAGAIVLALVTET